MARLIALIKVRRKNVSIVQNGGDCNSVAAAIEADVLMRSAGAFRHNKPMFIIKRLTIKWLGNQALLCELKHSMQVPRYL